MIQVDTPRKVNVGREVLDPTMWGDGKIESTPHGHFSKMMGSDPHLSVQGNKTRCSSIQIDDFNIIKGKEIVDRECPKGKKMIETAVSKDHIQALLHS